MITKIIWVQKPKQKTEIEQISTKMCASRETAKASKYDKETNEGAVTTHNPIPDQGEEGI